MSKLPASVKNSIQSRIRSQEEAEQQKQLEFQKEQEKEKEIKSKVYDLKVYDSSAYNEVLRNIKSKILEYFQNSDNSSSFKVPSFDEMKTGNNPKLYISNNVYKAEYTLEDHSRKSVDYGSYIQAGSHDVREKKVITLVTGNDNSCSLFNSISANLPAFKIQDYEVMTTATFPNIKVDYTKGITIIKIKKEIITFVEYPPPDVIQNTILEKLKGTPKGKYLVKYEFGNIMGEEFIKVSTERSGPQPPGFGSVW